MPEHGFTVTFPNDWTVWEGPEEWPTTKARYIYTGRIPMFRELLYAESPIHATGFEQCEVQSFAYPDLTPFDIA